MSSNIARYYDASKNPDGGALGGVPLDDIDQATWDGLAPHQQASADALPFYRKTKLPAPKPAEDAPAEEKPAPAPKPPPVAAPDKET